MRYTLFTLRSQQYVQNVSANTCISTFVPMSLSDVNGISPFRILSNTFLNLFYTVFDYDKNRVGFAPAAPAGTVEEAWNKHKVK